MVQKIASIFDLGARARARPSPVIFDCVHGGSEQELTLQRNLAKQRKVGEALICRAQQAQCPALALTLDLHVQGKRWDDEKHGLGVPPQFTLSNLADMLCHPRWLASMARGRRRTVGDLQGEVGQAANVSGLARWIAEQFAPSFDIETAKWARKRWQGKSVLKDIMHPDGARQALQAGADAIIVSNHGGRQLDSAPSSIAVLPAIADAVGAHIEVLFDGGIRTAADIVKALARGAHACLYGRRAEGAQGGGQ